MVFNESPASGQQKRRRIEVRNSPLESDNIEEADEVHESDDSNASYGNGHLSDQDKSSGKDDGDALFNHQSVLQKAASFCFGTLNLQLDCVDPVWNPIYGPNRPINLKHVDDLLDGFQSGIYRTEPQNHLYVACSAGTWAQLRKHCEDPNTRLSNPDNPVNNDTHLPSKNERRSIVEALFSPEPSTSVASSPIIWDWKNNGPCRLELLAGQHRMEALRRFLKNKYGENASDQIAQHFWWTCMIYNQGNLGFKIIYLRNLYILPFSIPAQALKLS